MRKDVLNLLNELNLGVVGLGLASRVSGHANVEFSRDDSAATGTPANGDGNDKIRVVRKHAMDRDGAWIHGVLDIRVVLGIGVTGVHVSGVSKVVS